jgi:Fic family protein
MFAAGKKVKREQIDYLNMIKPVLQQSCSIQTAEKNKQVAINGDFAVKLNELFQRVGELEEKNDVDKKESVRKARIKENIISLLEQHKKLSSSELGNLLNLSRTRCNEYFRELSKEGLVEGTIVDRQKFYKPVKR